MVVDDMKSLAEAIEAHNALDRVVNQMTAEAFREQTARKAQEEKYTDEVMDEIAEQIRAWAFNAGLSTREQFAEVMNRGELGSEALDYLTRIGAETPEAAVEALYRLAGDEAGIMLVDRFTTAFDEKVFGSRSSLDAFIKPDLPPSPPRRANTKTRIARRVGRWRADAESMTAADEAAELGFNPFTDE